MATAISWCVVLPRSSPAGTRTPLHVYLKTFGEYACEIEIEAYSSLTDAEPFKRSVQELLLQIQSVLAERNIPLAIQTVELRS